MNEKRNLDGLLVQNGLAQNAVIAHHLAVITGKHNNRIIRLPALLKRSENLANRAINQRNIAIIARANSTPALICAKIVTVFFGLHIISGQNAIEKRRISRRLLAKRGTNGKF